MKTSKEKLLNLNLFSLIRNKKLEMKINESYFSYIIQIILFLLLLINKLS